MNQDKNTKKQSLMDKFIVRNANTVTDKEDEINAAQKDLKETFTEKNLTEDQGEVLKKVPNTEKALKDVQETDFPDVDELNETPVISSNTMKEDDTTTGEKDSTDEKNDKNENHNPFQEDNDDDDNQEEEMRDEEKALVLVDSTPSQHYQVGLGLPEEKEDYEDESNMDVVVWNHDNKKTADSSASKPTRTAIIPFQKKYSDIPDDKGTRRKFRVGDYEISISNSKAPYAGLIASGLLLIASLLFKDDVFKTKMATYGYILSSVAILGGIILLILPTSTTAMESRHSCIMYFQYFLFVWCFIGACIMTFKPGPFIQTGNGYFASWGMVVFIAAAANPPGDSTLTHRILDNINSAMDLGAASVLFIVALAVEFHDGLVDYKGEAIYAICVAVVSVFLVLLLAVLKYISKLNVATTTTGEALLWSLVALAWIVAAILVTFRGPFDVMGNGYFSSWIGASLAFHTATTSWKARHSID